MAHTIAIVGGGFSGTLTAVHLLRGAWPGGLHVVLVNRSGPLARGVAYGTRSAAHVLNVPAARMGAFPDDEEHFLRYARGRDPSVVGGDFVPRSLYGDYLEQVLADAVAAAPAGTRFTHRVARAVDVRVCPGRGAELVLEGDGGPPVLAADRVVLAAGSYSPADPPVPDAAFFADDPRYVRDPWAPGALEGVDRSRPVFLVGTGLTMLDVALDLHGRRLGAPMLALSRRGLVPRPHRSPALPPHPVDWDGALLAGPATARRYLREVRRAVAEHPDVDWRDVLASLRPVTPALWAALPLAERARFLRHLQPYWDVHRHRAAPSIISGFEGLVRDGRLRFCAGRLLRVRGGSGGVAVRFRRRGTQTVEEVRVGAVVNCTGPSSNVAALGEPLLDSLLRQGLIT
ncbi:MAG TPA: FAD/NAD(P)-binding protein, partial [Longimicrobium sp.]|nr:FAD/NAD(P)-binding protein [Longimicrobium sp.]